MIHPLPPRPFTTTDTEGSTSQRPTNPIAGPCHPSPSLTTSTTCAACTICSNPPKYTCPKCSSRTCSLVCFKSHKSRDDCDGQRDPTAYVSLKDVGQGNWADDYRWLEEGRRKVAEWGEGLPRDTTGRGGGRGGRGGRGDRGRGRGGGRVRGDGRVVGLGKELERRGVLVEFMPEGMERRRKNQSSWNTRAQTLYLTIQLLPQAELNKIGQGVRSDITHSRVTVAALNTNLPTLSSLVPPELLSETANLVLAIPYHIPSSDESTHPASSLAQYYFPPLEMTTSVEEALRGTCFVEFPTIHLYLRKEWDEKVERGKIVVMPLRQYQMGSRDSGWGKRKGVEPEMDGMELEEEKRIKVEAETRAVVTSSGLIGLGDYDSEENSDDEGGNGDVGHMVM